MYPKTAWQARIQGKRPKRTLRQTWKEGLQMTLKERGIEWNRDRDRWKALCKPSTPIGRRGSNKWSEVKWCFDGIYSASLIHIPDYPESNPRWLQSSRACVHFKVTTFFALLTNRCTWICWSKAGVSWCQWPRGLSREFAAARLLGLRGRIPPRAWMSVSCECCAIQVEVSASGWPLYQRSPTDCGVSECDHEASIMRPRPIAGCRAMGRTGIRGWLYSYFTVLYQVMKLCNVEQDMVHFM
jgi:hypothetical protein